MKTAMTALLMTSTLMSHLAFAEAPINTSGTPPISAEAMRAKELKAKISDLQKQAHAETQVALQTDVHDTASASR